MHGKTLGIALASLLTLALTASLALARPGVGPGNGPAGINCPGYGYNMSQLSPEKQAAFQKLHDDFAAKTEQLRANLGVKRAELYALAVSSNPDQAKIDALTKEIGDMQGQLLAARVQFRTQVNKEIGPNVMGWGGMGRGGMGWGGHGYHHRGGFGPCGGGF